MRKIYLSLFSVLMSFGLVSVSAQVSGYQMTPSAGVFVPLTGATDVPGMQADSYLSGDLPLGFTFNYDGTDYTTFRASSNGFISFGTSTSNQTTNNLDFVAADSRPLIAPLWDDHDGRATGGSQAGYLVTGTAPNRVFTFEWLNWEWNYASSSPVVSFQVKLYETTNVIEFVYEDAGNAVNSGSASIGLTGTNDFISLDGSGANPNVSTTTETSSISTKPASGQIYSFVPPSCLGAGNLSVTNLTATSADFNWVENGGATEWEVVYGADGFTPTATGATTTSNPLASGVLTASTDYDFYVRSVCAPGDTSVWSGPFSFTTPCSVLIPPYTQTFDTFLPDACWDQADAGTIATGPSSIGSSPWGSNTYLGNNTADINIYGTSRSDWVLTPFFDLSGGQYEVNIDVAVTNWNSSATDAMGSDDEVVLAYSEDGVTWNPINTWTAADNLPNALTGYTFYDPSNGANVQFGIYASSGSTSGQDYDFHIDNFNIQLMPACPDPSNLMATDIDNDSVVITWDAGYQETDWNVELGAPGFAPGTGVQTYAGTVSGTATDTIPGLTQLTDYDVYVQADCGGGDMSAWVGPVNFTTAATCADVSNVAVDSIVGTDMFISWTSNGVESSWDVEYGMEGFTQGTGMMMTTDATNDTIFGIVSNTTYDIYVRSDCGGVDQGAWIGPLTYTTSCVDIQPTVLPFVEDFESMNGTIIGDSLFYCGSDKSWDFTTDNQGFGRLRYGTDAFAQIAGNGAMTFDVSDDFEEAISYATLRLDLSGYAASTDLKLSLKYMENGDETDAQDRVWIRGSENDVWIEVLDWNAGTGGTDNVVFQLNEFDISGTLAGSSQVPTSTFEVRFGWSDNYPAESGPDGVTFDDIRIEEVTCAMPTDFVQTYSNADTVVVDWNSNGSEVEWAIEYGNDGFGVGSGTMFSTLNHPDTITNLVPGTIYNAYVTAVCAVGDSSRPYGPINVVPNVENDEGCNAILVSVDGSTNNFSNYGATNTGEPGNTMYNTVWFEFVAPTSGHVAIATCGATVSNELSVFELVPDCADYNTYTEMDHSTTNPWGCEGSNTPAGLEVCGLTPGETYKFKIGNASSTGDYHVFPLTLWDLEYDAGVAGTADACAGIDTVNLLPLISGTYSYYTDGVYEYTTNSTVIVDDTLAVAGNFTLGNDEVLYIVENDCMADTAFIVVNVATESNTGAAIPGFTSCNSDVFLPDGLTGTVDAGGVWTDDAGTNLLAGPNGNVFVGGSAPIGTYPFTYTVGNGVCPPSSTTLNVTITNCTSVEENGAAFNLYPNPNDGSFFITSTLNEVVTITVMDVQGKVVSNNRVNIGAGTPAEVNLNDAKVGMYFVRISSESSVSTINVVVK